MPRRTLTAAPVELFARQHLPISSHESTECPCRFFSMLIRLSQMLHLVIVLLAPLNHRYLILNGWYFTTIDISHAKGSLDCFNYSIYINAELILATYIDGAFLAPFDLGDLYFLYGSACIIAPLTANMPMATHAGRITSLYTLLSLARLKSAAVDVLQFVSAYFSISCQRCHFIRRFRVS